jgi:hypothetical protein
VDAVIPADKNIIIFSVIHHARNEKNLVVSVKTNRQDGFRDNIPLPTGWKQYAGKPALIQVH